MVALYLIEFVLIFLIAIALIWAVQRMIARARSQARAQSYAQEIMRYDEARKLVLQQAQRLVEQGMTFEQAVSTALSDGYWPDSAAGAVDADRTTNTNAVQANTAERKTE